MLAKFDVPTQTALISGLVAANHKVLLTSRSNLYETEKIWIDILSSSINGALALGDEELAKQKLQIMHLPRFGQWDMFQFLSKKFPKYESKLSWKLMTIYNLEDVSASPLMLHFLSGVLPAANEKCLSVEDSLYSLLVKLWFEREKSRGVDEKLVINFMTRLAVDMFLQNLKELTFDELSIRVRQFFVKENPQGIEFTDFNSMIRLSGFLSRTLDKYSFSFPSIKEYLVANTIKEKIVRKEVELIEDPENIVFPDHCDFGYAKMNKGEIVLEQINKKHKTNFSKIFDLSEGFIRLLGSILLNHKVEDEISVATFNSFAEKNHREEDFSALYQAAQRMRGKTETKVNQKRVKQAFKNVHMIGGEGRIYYNFNVYSFALLVNEHDPNAKWSITVTKSKSWIHT